MDATYSENTIMVQGSHHFSTRQQDRHSYLSDMARLHMSHPPFLNETNNKKDKVILGV